jgi:hypothetical protein
MPINEYLIDVTTALSITALRDIERQSTTTQLQLFPLNLTTHKHVRI